MSKSFIATLGVGKGTWGHVSRLISEQEFDRIILISTDWVKENFHPQKECEWILINNRAGFDVIKDEIKQKLPEGELTVSIISGSGKEHTALLSALKEDGKEYKLIILTGSGTKFY
ncbi:MAG: hypothetical protein HYW50_03275 [Candidatus Diapherotrites archaeon]|nr:hypothetical protein [Candidatus Diapherotrites archaeon]